VVEHREAADRVEGLVGKGRLCGVADLDGDVRAGELVGKERGRVLVELERDEPLDSVPEPARRGAWAGPELEHLGAEIDAGGDGLEHLRLHEHGPLGRRAEGVVLVHGNRG